MLPLIIDASGWLHGENIRHLPSPHHNPRPDPGDISLCVLHNITLPPQHFGRHYIDRLFLGQLAAHQDEHPFFAGIAALRVSAHFFVARDGGITQYVSTLARAWHAGDSCYCGRENCNDYSIGIELNGCDHHPYTLRQYQRSAALICALKQRHPRLSDLTTHRHIAPERKTDPGPAFKQHYLEQLLADADTPLRLSGKR